MDKYDENLKERLEIAMKEVKEIREGKREKRSAREILKELRSRAEIKKRDPNLRQEATEKELQIYNQNALDMQEEQFRTIKDEKR